MKSTIPVPASSAKPPAEYRPRRVLPSYAVRRFVRVYGLPQSTAAEIARVSGFPQEAGI
jgi:hypothetical protein